MLHKPGLIWERDGHKDVCKNYEVVCLLGFLGFAREFEGIEINRKRGFERLSHQVMPDLEIRPAGEGLTLQ